MSINPFSTPLRADAAELLRISDAIEAVAQRLEALAATTLAPEVVQPPPSPGIGPTAGLLDETAWKTFFDYVRSRPPLGPELVPAEVAGCKRILTACADERLPASWAAYVLATIWHETGGKLEPVVENLYYTTPERIRAVWPSRFPTIESARPFIGSPKALANKVYGGRTDLGNTQPNDGWDFRGRGLPQVTGRANYRRVDDKLGLEGTLVANPDKMLEWGVCLPATIIGMREGWFTGKSLNDRIGPPPAPERQFVKARAIINPDENGPLVASYATTFQDGLIAAGWS